MSLEGQLVLTIEYVLCIYDIAMLCAERLCELPLEVRIIVARMDIEVYMRMYLWDDEFREYANKEYAIDDFIERFVVKRMYDYKIYKLGNNEYHKYDNGRQARYMNGKLHRDGGPALIYANGEQEYWINGKLHRDGGPAVIHVSGYKAYYQHGKRHRLNGPAIICTDGREKYYEYGAEIKY